MAGVAGDDAEAVHSAAWRLVDVPGDLAPPRSGDLRRAGGHHQSRLSVSRSGADAADRRLGRHRPGAGAPRFGRGRGRGLRTGEPARRRCGRRGLRRRPCGARRRDVPQPVPQGRRGGVAGLYRDAGHQADPSGDRLRLYPSGRAGRGGRGRRQGRGLRRKAGPGDRRTLYRRRLSVEFRQFLLPRRRHARRAAGLPAGDRQRGGRGLRRRPSRPRLPRARQGIVRPRAQNLDRLRGDGAHRPCGGHSGRHRLERRRQLAGGLGPVGPRRERQFRARQGRRDGRPQCPHPFGRAPDHGARRRRRDRGDDGRRGAGAGRAAWRQGQATGRRAEDAANSRRRRSTAGSIVPGAITSRSTMASAIRSSASSSSPATSCRCRSIITAPSTGSWCAARPK